MDVAPLQSAGSFQIVKGRSGDHRLQVLGYEERAVTDANRDLGGGKPRFVNVPESF